MIIKFFAKLFLFILILFCIQLCVAEPLVIPNELNNMEKALQFGANVLYFGDSTIVYSSKTDPSTQSTPELLMRMLPKSTLWTVTHNSLDLHAYDAYVDYMLRKGYHPKFLIFPINLRSFSPVWAHNPTMQFESEEFIIRTKDTIWSKFYHPLGVFKYFEPPYSQIVYENTPIEFHHQNYGRLKDLMETANSTPDDETKQKKQFILDYLYQLTPKYNKIHSMLRLVQRLKGTGIEPIFYITPVDVQTGTQLLGDDFIKTLRNNAHVIDSLLTQRSINILDFSSSLPSTCFMWREEGYPNEHLNLLGRYFLATSLAQRSNLKDYK